MATIRGNKNSTEENALSLLGNACMRMDLITIHDIMMEAQYEDDNVGEEKIEERGSIAKRDHRNGMVVWFSHQDRQISFRGWTVDMQNILNTRKHGDLAFQDKDFGVAILWYNRVVDSHLLESPTVYARRSLAYLYCGLPEAALLDAMKAHWLKHDWPTAFYLQAAALIKLGMKDDAADMLEEGVALEKRRRNLE